MGKQDDPERLFEGTLIETNILPKDAFRITYIRQEVLAEIVSVKFTKRGGDYVIDDQPFSSSQPMIIIRAWVYREGASHKSRLPITIFFKDRKHTAGNQRYAKPLSAGNIIVARGNYICNTPESLWMDAWSIQFTLEGIIQGISNIQEREVVRPLDDIGFDEDET